MYNPNPVCLTIYQVATEADLGLADAYINGYYSFVDNRYGLLNLLLVCHNFPSPYKYVTYTICLQRFTQVSWMIVSNSARYRFLFLTEMQARDLIPLPGKGL